MAQGGGFAAPMPPVWNKYKLFKDNFNQQFISVDFLFTDILIFLMKISWHKISKTHIGKRFFDFFKILKN